MGDGPNDIPETVAGTPESFGWQRRADMDKFGAKAWESPTGEILLTARPPIFVKLKGRPPWIITDVNPGNANAG